MRFPWDFCPRSRYVCVSALVVAAAALAFLMLVLVVVVLLLLVVPGVGRFRPPLLPPRKGRREPGVRARGVDA